MTSECGPASQLPALCTVPPRLLLLVQHKLEYPISEEAQGYDSTLHDKTYHVYTQHYYKNNSNTFKTPKKHVK